MARKFESYSLTYLASFITVLIFFSPKCNVDNLEALKPKPKQKRFIFVLFCHNHAGL